MSHFDTMGVVEETENDDPLPSKSQKSKVGYVHRDGYIRLDEGANDHIHSHMWISGEHEGKSMRICWKCGCRERKVDLVDVMQKFGYLTK